MKYNVLVLLVCLIGCFDVMGQVGGGNDSDGSGGGYGSYTPPEVGGCEVISGSRNFIRGLMNSSSLRVGCPYVVEGYSRGCINGDIVLVAGDVNSFSMDAEILTPFDSDMWEVRYDINSNRLIEVKDNLGNEVGGRYGNEVDRFPWGLTNVWGNSIYNADVYFDCGTGASIYENSWSDNAYTDLRGFSGVFSESDIYAYGRIYMNGSELMDFRRNDVSSYSYLYFTGTDNSFIRQSKFSSSCYVRKFNTATGRFTLYDSVIERGDVRHYGGVAYCDDINVSSGGRLYMREGGNQDIRNTSISDLTYVNLQSVGGNTRLWRCNLSGLSYFYLRTGVTGGNRYYYSHVQSGSTYDYRSGSGNITMSNNNQNSNGYIRWDNISGDYRIYQNDISSRAEYRLTGTSGTHSHYYNNMSNYISRINLNGCTGSTIQRNNLSGDGRIEGSLGNPRVYYCNITGIGVLTLRGYTGTVQRSSLMSDSRVNLSGSGNMYGCTFGTSFVFNSTNLNHSYITAMGNITHTAGGSNVNRANIHNLINNLL